MSHPKVAVVTGANKGIGYAIVKGLCEKFPGTVYLTARDVTRGEAAVSKLKKLGLNPLFHQLDITDSNSTTKFRDYLVEKHGGLDLLVNNAGILLSGTGKARFGDLAETTVKINYFSTLKVCEILFPILKNNAVVVNISSSEGHLSKIPSLGLRAKLNDPNLTVTGLNQLMEEYIQAAKNNQQEETGWGYSRSYSAYSVSKVGISALTKVQQREFDREVPCRNVHVNSVHPGYVRTDMTGQSGFLTTEEGARAPLFAALEAENMKGQYVWANATVIPWDSEQTPTRF